MTALKIPTPLRPYADGNSEIQVEASNVGQALDILVEQHPALIKHLFNEEGELRAFVNLFLNSEDVRYMDGPQTPLKAEDQLMIVPSIAGGR